MLLVVLVAATGLVSCKPKTVTEAEERKNVEWLAANGSPEAVQALGRLADKDPDAQKALDDRVESQNDVNVYIAAWSAVLRNATWGTTTLRNALADPQHADTAASAMARRDPHLGAFANAFEAALVKGGTSTRNLEVSALLASIGTPAHDVIERRLRDKATRGAMCRGIAAPEASEDARQTLLKVDASGRDDVDCVDVVVRIAAADDGTLAWLAQLGEPGILTQAGKSEVIACPRMKQLWTEAVQARPAATYVALTVPLSEAVKRCGAALDPLLATEVTKGAAAQSLVVGAIDPVGTATSDLRTTCSALPLVLRGAAPARTRDRAADIVAHGCKTATAAATTARAR